MFVACRAFMEAVQVGSQLRPLPRSAADPTGVAAWLRVRAQDLGHLSAQSFVDRFTPGFVGVQQGKLVLTQKAMHAFVMDVCDDVRNLVWQLPACARSHLGVAS